MKVWHPIRLLLPLLLLATAVGQQPLPQDPFASLHAEVDAAAEAAIERATSAVPAARFDELTVDSRPDPGSGPHLVNFAQAYWSGETKAARRALARVEALRDVVEPILREEGAPSWILAVMLVESGGKLDVTSPKGARGLWQFMPATARRYGLVVSEHRDDRIDIVLATRAAARHLQDLYKVFGDWELALAAYNYGEGGVQRVLKRLGASDFRTAAVALPAETRLYVPAVTAAARLLRSGALDMPNGQAGQRWFATTTPGN